jgi:phytoene/squalene synthetase
MDPRRVALARAVTRTASTQTYLTIRFLVEPQRRDAAFCAYAYFRWVDDVLDGHEDEPPETTRTARISFLERQKALVESCLQGETPAGVNGHEALLIDLLRSPAATTDELRTYVEQMMRVMEFDARRRGRVVSAADLDQYTGWLAMAVTEAMHYFLGGATYQPHDEARYSAVTGAHILHMLRDTYADLGAGYVNIPREVLDANAIGPTDVTADAYREWVRDRSQLARTYLDIGRAYFRRIESWRHRLAGLAYIARFEWLVDRLETEGYVVRPSYDRRANLAVGLKVGIQSAWHATPS